MICKKCGAYNPDHATYCKVCAASLKEQTDADDAVQATETEEAAENEFRPRRGNVKMPDFSSVRRAGSFKAAQDAMESAKEDDEDEKEEVNEEVTPASKKPVFSRPAPAAPAKKRRVVDEDYDDDEDDEDDYDEEEEVKHASKKSIFARAAASKKRVESEDEDDEDEEESDAEKLESEPETTRFARPSANKRRLVEEDEDEDDEDEYDEDEDDDEEDEDDDEYEEYEPTPPRRKKSGRGQSKGRDGGFNIVALLIVCLLAILLIIVGIIAFCNIKGGATKSKLPGFLQFNCSGKATTEKTTQPQQLNVPSQDVQSSDPTDSPVTGIPLDYSVTKMEDKGNTVEITVYTRPGDTVTVKMPAPQSDRVAKNDGDTDLSYLVTIDKACYYPNEPLTESNAVQTITPEIMVTHADGTTEALKVDSFDISYPFLHLELKDPAQDTITEEGVMAPEGNKMIINGKVDDHTVSVTVNGKPIDHIYEGGNFDTAFALSGEEPETVTIVASKINCVTTSYSFTVRPYVFIPEKMKLTVVSKIDKLRADKNNKVIITGTTVPGATLTAAPIAEYTTAIACGSPTVDAEGNYSFEATFDKDYYGIATIAIHAKMDGYEDGEITCNASRMYADRAKAITGYRKINSYHEVPAYDFAKVLENPTEAGLYRFEGKIVEIDPETGVITFAAKTSKKETVNIYVLNAAAKWDPSKKIGKDIKLYTTLNGLYTDDSSLYVTAWFVV